MHDLIECPECNELQEPNRFNPKFPECFRCRARGIGFSYGTGGREAKQQFHDTTIKEFQERTIAEAAANGIEAVPAWTKTNYSAPTKAFEAKTAAAIESTITKTAVTG